MISYCEEQLYSKKVESSKLSIFNPNYSDSYGFIESEDHSRETFFHYSELSCKPEEIEHGTTVQYYEKLKDNKICGINVVPLEEEIDLNGDEDVEDHVRHGTGICNFIEHSLTLL